MPSFEFDDSSPDISYEDDQVNRAASFNLNCFHEKYANFPKSELFSAFQHVEPILDALKKDLYPDMQRFEYIGNAFTTLSIKKEPLEFQILVIFDGRYSELVYNEGLKKGYAQIKPPYTKYCSECDEMGYLNPKKFREYFYGVIRKFCHKLTEYKMTLVEINGVTKLVVYKDTRGKEPWYSVELLPCFEFKVYQGETLSFILFAVTILSLISDAPQRP